MNDEQYSDRFLAANAYLDGELTAAERARAEDDPALMAAVDELRALQDLVRDVEPSSAAARESAIAAAMAEFRTAGARPSRVREIRESTRHQQLPRYLAIAAAVVGVGVLGVVIASTGLRSSDDDDSAAVAPSEAGDTQADARADDRIPTELTDATADAAITGDDSGGAELAPTAAATGDDTGDDASGDAIIESTGGSEPLFGRPIVEPATPPDDARLPAPEQLTAVAVAAIDEFDAGTAPPPPETDCVFDTTTGELLALHEFESDAGTIELLIGVDRVNGVAYGVDRDTCEILVRAPLP